MLVLNDEVWSDLRKQQTCWSVPERLWAAAAGGSATLYRSSRAGARSPPCDRPHPDTPETEPSSPRSDTTTHNILREQSYAHSRTQRNNALEENREWERWKDVFWVNVKKTTNVAYSSPQKLNNIYLTYIMRPNCRTFIVFFNDNLIIIKYIKSIQIVMLLNYAHKIHCIQTGSLLY